MSDAVTFQHIPVDLYPRFFSQFKAADLLIAERVCKVWKNTASGDEVWKCHIMRGLTFNSQTPIKAQVLLSYHHYCVAAYIIFPDFTKNVPTGLSVARTKQLIDEQIEGAVEGAVQKASCETLSTDYSKLPNHIGLLQVWQKVGAEVDESTLSYLIDLDTPDQLGFEQTATYITTFIQEPSHAVVYEAIKMHVFHTQLKWREDLNAKLEFPDYVHALIKKVLFFDSLISLITPQDVKHQYNFTDEDSAKLCKRITGAVQAIRKEGFPELPILGKVLS